MWQALWASYPRSGVWRTELVVCSRRARLLVQEQIAKTSISQLEQDCYEQEQKGAEVFCLQAPECCWQAWLDG
jgi:hypothetical protein